MGSEGALFSCLTLADSQFLCYNSFQEDRL